MNSRVFHFLIGACLAMGACKRSEQHPNGGFEEGLTAWKLASGDAQSAMVIAEAARTGKSGLRITDVNPTSDVVLRWKRVATLPGDRWRIRFHGRVLSGYGVNVYARFLNDQKVEVGKPDDEPFHRGVPKGQSEWVEFEFEALSPEGAAVIEVYVRSNNAAIVTADFDDFSLERIN